MTILKNLDKNSDMNLDRNQENSHDKTLETNEENNQENNPENTLENKNKSHANDANEDNDIKDIKDTKDTNDTNYSNVNAITPLEILKELDKYIIGQNNVKKAVAIALRNRWRRSKLSENLQKEILPSNILIIGPTGTGKTEIARRLANIISSPFIKVEATKFTEIGYVGRDVEQIIRDLMENAIMLIKEREKKKRKIEIEKKVNEEIVNKLLSEDISESTRSKYLIKVETGQMDRMEIEIEVPEAKPSMDLGGINNNGMPGLGNIGMINISDILGKSGSSSTRKKMNVRDAKKILFNVESEKVINQSMIIENAKELVESHGIVFIDEIDKLSNKGENARGEVSREGVQRDLLPIMEGTLVNTKYGGIKTDHILFIASGAFHLSKPSDLLPELQGRLPVRVEAQSLSQNDFMNILTKTENNLLMQQKMLMSVEGFDLQFDEESIAEMARIAVFVNDSVENIGARRLRSVLEKVMHDISFDAVNNSGEFVVTIEYVKSKLDDIARDKDLSRYIL